MRGLRWLDGLRRMAFVTIAFLALRTLELLTLWLVLVLVLDYSGSGPYGGYSEFHPFKLPKLLFTYYYIAFGYLIFSWLVFLGAWAIHSIRSMKSITIVNVAGFFVHAAVVGLIFSPETAYWVLFLFGLLANGFGPTALRPVFSRLLPRFYATGSGAELSG